MQTNITKEQLSSSFSSPEEPHFNDEATVLSARPVVPIGELTSKAGFSRPWIFGLAVSGALLLGVFATAFYYSRFRTIEGQSVVNITTASSDVQGVASEPPNLSGPPEANGTTASDDSFADSNKSAKAKTQSSSRLLITSPLNSSRDRLKKPAPRRETRIIDQRSNHEHETRDERGAARSESKERKRENRERRAARRSDEVLRIREIFEGPARP